MHRFRCVALSIALMLAAGCGADQDLTAPDLARGGPRLTVTPAALALIAPAGSPATITARVQYVGLISAASSDVGCATVSPQSAPAAKAEGSPVYVATFAVTPVGAGTCSITLTDKRGQQVVVAATVAAGGPQGIVFTSNRSGEPELYRMHEDGSNVVPLTPSQPLLESSPAVSPDRNRIAFIANHPDQLIWNLDLMQADGSGRVTVADVAKAALAADPAFSPDGARLVFTSRQDRGTGEIYSIRTDGTDLLRLTDNESRVEQEPTYAPDGRIAFNAGPFGESWHNLYLMNADGTGEQSLGPGANPAFSPDGSELAFEAIADGSYEVYVMNLTTGVVRQLTHNDWDDSRPAYSPDGLRIAFVSERDGNVEIYVMSAADGSGQANLSNDPAHDTEPSWR